LGVLERTRVAEEVKALDQPARASLRKYGVRFGAYHVYVPALLKPARRALAAQLWALRNDRTESKVVDDILQLAASGRTSMATDPTIDAALYRTAGYRACGARAVRVDILERLADLIRPALAWREGTSPGAKPAAAIAGGGFIVSNPMTSLTGASGEEFASILRALGYRMERRPKPPEELSENPAAISLPAASAAIENAGAGTTSEPGEASAADEAAASSDHIEASLPPADLAPTPPDPSSAAATGEPELVLAAEPMQASREVASATDQTAASPVGDIVPPQEPEMIEVWRPGRADGRWRDRSRQQTRTRRAQKQPAAAQRAEQADTPALRAGSPPEATEQPGGTSVQARPRQHGRKRRKPEHRADRAQHDRPATKRFERREKLPDPNSPFAKLAGLKAQLEADAKERPKERR